MARIIKGRQMSARYWKGREVLKEYKQGRLVYEKQTSIPDYLCFTALEAGTFTLTVPAAVTSSYLSYVEYSLDGQNWTRLTVDSTDQSITAGTAQNPIPAGDKVYWRGSGQCMTARNATLGQQSTFSSTGTFDVSGHIMSLLKGDDFADYEALTTYANDGIRNYTFVRLFYQCDTVINAKDLVLPTFTSYHTYIFYSFLHDCTSLITAPALPSTELADNCYGSFLRNTSITIPPTLSATIMRTGCYSAMFYGCRSLTRTAENPATVLAVSCFSFMYSNCTLIEKGSDITAEVLPQTCCDRMYQGCTNLKYVKCLATDMSATNCLNNWLQNVSSTGTFIQAAGVTWPAGKSGIPNNWTIQTETT